MRYVIDTHFSHCDCEVAPLQNHLCRCLSWVLLDIRRSGKLSMSKICQTAIQRHASLNSCLMFSKLQFAVVAYRDVFWVPDCRLTEDTTEDCCQFGTEKEMKMKDGFTALMEWMNPSFWEAIYCYDECTRSRNMFLLFTASLLTSLFSGICLLYDVQTVLIIRL